MLGAIQHTYYEHKGDIAAALTAALQAAHSQIRQFSQAHHVHFTGGATCLVATGAEVVSAQAGPTILAVNSNAGMQWFSPLNHEDYIPLGGRDTPAVEIGRTPGYPGVVIVAMNSGWANYLEVQAMMEATAVPRAQAVADQLAGIGIDAPEELTILVVTLAEAEGQAAMKAPPKPVTMSTPPAVAVPSPEIPTAPRAGATTTVGTVATVGDEDIWEEVSEDEYLVEEKTSRAKSANSQRSMGAAVAAAGQGVGDFVRKMLPERRGSALRPGEFRRTPPRRIPFAVAIAGVLVLAIAIITLGMWYLQGRQRAQLFRELMVGAQTNYQAAVATVDEPQARGYLQVASEQLEQAAIFYPDDPTVLALRGQISERQAQVNHVTPLRAGFDLPLISFDPATRSPSRVFVNGLGVYVLDPVLASWNGTSLMRTPAIA